MHAQVCHMFSVFGALMGPSSTAAALKRLAMLPPAKLPTTAKGRLACGAAERQACEGFYRCACVAWVAACLEACA